MSRPASLVASSQPVSVSQMSIPAWQNEDAARPRIMSVAELTAEIKELLESRFLDVWVAGEISNHKAHRSGHVYLTLKDEHAQIGCVIWRSVAQRIPFDLFDGLKVIVFGRLSVYAPQGKYQLVIQRLLPQGIGALELAFRQLRDRLAREGLFDPSKKQPLPKFPKRLVLVSSPSGAAVRDMLQILRRRWRDLEIWICPVRVQGDGAAEEIAAAIEMVNRLKDVDLMIVGRGGGSLEDLWAFNEEVVARAIFASRIPIISAVGHEVDVTIADLVADRRALTPSEAAELAVPDEREVRQRLDGYAMRVARALGDHWMAVKRQLDLLAGRRPFRFPLDSVRLRQQRCDELAGRLERAVLQHVRDAGHRCARLAAALESLSPLNVLARGYSLTTRADGRTVVRDAAAVDDGERLVTRLARGRIVSRVEQRFS